MPQGLLSLVIYFIRLKGKNTKRKVAQDERAKYRQLDGCNMPVQCVCLCVCIFMYQSSMLCIFTFTRSVRASECSNVRKTLHMCTYVSVCIFTCTCVSM